MESFGRYRLIRPIAAGGMGEIFLARSSGIDGFEKDVVIKRLKSALCANESFVSMFIDEARVSVSLSHHNIVPVFDFGQVDGSYYLAMEVVRGSDLRGILKLPSIAGRGLEPGLALFIIAEVLAGLDYAHNKRSRTGEPLHLVHRDLTPDNVMVTFTGGVKVMDFGIAKARGQLTKLAPGTVVGKVQYVSPEHFRGEPVDARADVFSVGTVLWELLCGRRAYEHEGTPDEALFARIGVGQIERPSAVNRELPKAIDKLLAKALAPIADERFSSAREFLDEIFELLRSRKFKGGDRYALEAFMAEHRARLDNGLFDVSPELERELSAEITLPPDPPAVRPRIPQASTVPTVVMPPRPAFGRRDEVLGLLSKQAATFRENPNVWTIVRMGELAAEHGDREAALACYRAAGVKFAQHALLAQSLLCAKRMLESKRSPELLAEIGQLPSLGGKSDHAVVPYLFRGGDQVSELLAEMLLSVPMAGRRPTTFAPLLLAQLEPEAFAQLADLGPIASHPADARIVTQGEPGSTMHLILSGRTVVHLDKPNGERMYLASLTAGEFFGEASFFSGLPRGATVEAQDPTTTLEIDRALYDRVMAGRALAAEILDRFYRERVAWNVLAASPLFSLLSAGQRRELIEAMEAVAIPAGTPLLEPGARPRFVHLLRTGEARVLDPTGATLATLRSGAIVGDVASLTGRVPDVSVVSARELDALRLPASLVGDIVSSAPRLERAILERLTGEA